MRSPELIWRWTVRLKNLLVRTGARPDETAEEQIRRLIWLVTLLSVAPFCVGAGTILLTLGCLPAAILCLALAVFYVVQVLVLAMWQRGLNILAFCSQLSCVLFSLSGVISMGGPAHSGGFIFVGLIGPLYALAFPSRRRAVLMFALCLAAVVVGVLCGDGIAWAQPLPTAVNVVLFGITTTVVSFSVFAALFYFLHERDRALQRLSEAEEKISRLLRSSPGVSDTLAGWSRATAREIADAIGGGDIGVWELAGHDLTPLSDEGLAAPSMDLLERASRSPEGILTAGLDSTVVAVAGVSGALCGAIVVARGPTSWSQSAQHLLAGFAHQLGAALDMKRLRVQAASAVERRALTRKELHEQGIATLQLCPQCGRCYDHTATACSADGSALESPQTLPCCLLGRYRFCQVLGTGGMGIVLAAWDEKLQRDVAVKLVRPEHFNNPELRHRFEREARTVAHIQHPGVISLYDSGELEDGTAFLVMEKLTGDSLACAIRNHGRGTPAQVAELVRQGCAALGAAHRVGVVHRDIKPENIFLVHDPAGFRVKILDFGLAKSLTSEKGLTHTGMLMGTPAYMSPEQVHGEELDARTDVYSFAAVCYEALTGVVLASGNDLGQILISVLNTEPPPPSSFIAGLPREVDCAFASALAKERMRRLKDVVLWGSSFVDALGGFCEAQPVGGWPSHPGAPAEQSRFQATELKSPGERVWQSRSRESPRR